MTLIVAVNTPESIWLLADRRLSYQGRPAKDDGRKVMLLETTDGVAILGYAGLGATALGTEPSDWMGAVLRSRNLPLEQSLGVLADTMEKRLPQHMKQMPRDGGPAHHVIVSAFLGNEPRLYTIDIALASGHSKPCFHYRRHVLPKPTQPTARLGGGGTGAQYLTQNNKWMRELFHVLRANDRGHVSSLVVADHLAKLNYEVHLGVTDKSVGPRCIVAWRNRRGGVHKGGGGDQFYTGVTRDASSASLPIIGNGMDLNALFGVLMPHMMKRLEAMRAGEPEKELDKDELNAELARLPDKPDEDLR